MGRAAAERFAADGAQVAVLARGKDALEETVETLRGLGAPDALGIPTDLTDANSVQAAFDTVTARWGSLNVLVNAAGPVEVGVRPFDELDDAEWLATFGIGTLSAVRCLCARGAAGAAGGRVGAHRQRQRPFHPAAGPRGWSPTPRPSRR
nr:SDR family NAD(P)-dependent oxidoreductase [Frankia sp. AgPm24]